MERLTPLAAAFLEAEDADGAASLAIGSFAVFEGPAPDFDDFVEAIAGRLALIPRYRQKVRHAASTCAGTCATPRCPLPGGRPRSGA